MRLSEVGQQTPQFPQYAPPASNAPGLLVPGNIDITKRLGKAPEDPITHNANGSTSTVYSGSFIDEHGRNVLVPFVIPDGKGKWKIGTDKEAWNHYLKTGEQLGIFDDPANADAYAQYLHMYLANVMEIGGVGKAPMRDESMNRRMNVATDAMATRLNQVGLQGAR